MTQTHDEELVEQVAAAIRQSDYEDCLPWERLKHHAAKGDMRCQNELEDYRVNAKAAIATLEPLITHKAKEELLTQMIACSPPNKASISRREKAMRHVIEAAFFALCAWGVIFLLALGAISFLAGEFPLP